MQVKRMKSIDRFYAFWWFCIPVRIAIGALATYLTLRDNLFWLVGVYATLTTVGLLFNAALTWAGRKRFGGLGGRVWWNRVRWVHILLWGLCAVLSFCRVRGAGSVLLVDAMVGVASGFFHFYLGKTL